jgi:hypothetical protein
MPIALYGGPRDGESVKPSRGEPPAVLIVDDSGGRYLLTDRCYLWVSWPWELVID